MIIRRAELSDAVTAVQARPSTLIGEVRVWAPGRRRLDAHNLIAFSTTVTEHSFRPVRTSHGQFRPICKVETGVGVLMGGKAW